MQALDHPEVAVGQRLLTVAAGGFIEVDFKWLQLTVQACSESQGLIRPELVPDIEPGFNARGIVEGKPLPVDTQVG